MRVLCPVLVGACLSLALPAFAQTATTPSVPPAGSAGGTIDGGLPEKTGATTGVGQTKPPGDALGENMGTRPDLEQKSKALDAKINQGICTGCK